MKSVYDEHVQFYLDFVDEGLHDEAGFVHVLKTAFDEVLGDRIRDARVCDVGCGEGYLGRHLVARGASEVVGIDLSVGLIDAARHRSDAPGLEYRVDDAQELATVPDASFDVVVSQLALMDMADHRRVFRAVRRVLNERGVFVFSILHPCFEGSPFSLPDEPKFLVDDDDAAIAYVVRRYATEGFWRSGGTGVRGRMGSHHRMLSTYVNNLVDAGFVIERMLEAIVPDRGPRGGDVPLHARLFAEVPPAVLLAAHVAEA